MFQAVFEYVGLGTAAKKNIGAGSGQVPDMSFYATLLSASGYQKLPSGLILQWGGSAGSLSGPVTYNYPIAYPNAVLAIIGSQSNVNGYGRGAAQSVPGNANTQYQVSSMTGTSSYAADTIRWFAIGY